MVNRLTVEIGGEVFTTFKSVEISSDLDTFGSDFNIDINVPIEKQDTILSRVVSLFEDDKPAFNTQGSLIKIKVDGEAILTGFIEKQEVTYSKNSANLNISGRDKLSDFSDSRVSNKTFKTPVGFIEILEKLLVDTGYEIISSGKSLLSVGLKLVGLGTDLAYNQVKVINEYGDNGQSIEKFKTNESIGFGADESAYNLIQRLADKRRLVVGTDGDGNIVIRSIGQDSSSTILVNDTSANKPNLKNNILNASIVRDDSKRYYEYKIFSHSSSISPTSSTSELGISQSDVSGRDSLNGNKTQYSGVFYDTEIRKTRKFLDNVSNLTNSLCKKRAEWECNIRRARAFQYKCSVYGWRQNIEELDSLGFIGNPLWKINQIVIVRDSRAGLLDEKLLIKSIRYTQDLDGGTRSEMVLVDPKSYTDSVFEIKIKAGRRKSNSMNVELIK
jgi:prophage tail gpP-like protein